MGSQRLRAAREGLHFPSKAERDMARLLSMKVGLPRDIAWKGSRGTENTSGILQSPNDHRFYPGYVRFLPRHFASHF
jgi:hypothetical protein